MKYMGTTGKKLKTKRYMEDLFKDVIWNYLLEVSEKEEAIRRAMENPLKSIESCVNYIYNEVRKSGRWGFCDEEIFGMALHYYDEKDLLEIKTTSDCRVVVNKSVELTEEEKRKAKEEAIKIYQEDLIREMKNPTQRKRRIEIPTTKQNDLFD